LVELMKPALSGQLPVYPGYTDDGDGDSDVAASAYNQFLMSCLDCLCEVCVCLREVYVV
jgi:hypothetical protein